MHALALVTDWCIVPQYIAVSRAKKSAPRPDSGHGAYAGAHRRVVFQKVLSPRIAWCSKLANLVLGSQFGPVLCAL